MARLDPGAETQDDFLALAAAMPHLVWVADPSGRIVFVNERWSAYTGVGIDGLAVPGRKEIVHDDDLAKTWEAWNHAIATGQPYEIEYRLRNGRDGTYSWFLARAVPVKDGSGAIRRWIGTATDIDAQRHTTDSLRFILTSAATLSALGSERAICDALVRIAIESYADWAIVLLRRTDGSFDVPSLTHRDPERVTFVEAYRERYPINSQSATARVVETGEAQLYSNVTEEQIAAAARDAEHLAVLQSLRIRSAMTVPISHGQTPALGALILFSSESQRVFTQSDVDVTVAVARYAASAIETARALEHERETSAALRFAERASELFASEPDLDAALASMLRAATKSIADIAYIWRVDEDGAVRMRAASAREERARATLSTCIGERLLHRDGENILKRRFAGDAYRVQPFSAESLDRFLFGYARRRFESLGITALLSLPLEVAGVPAGSLVFGRTGETSRFSDAETETLIGFARRVNLAIEQRELLRRERRIARELQQELLPRLEMLAHGDDMTLDVLYQPSTVDADIGGDWYDAVRLPNGEVVVSVGDVTGRGLSAAGIMGKLRQALAAISLYERDPARMLDALELLLRRRSQDAIATAFVGIISADRSTLRYANAGHPPPLLRRGPDIEALRAEGLPIGLRERHPSETVTTSLRDARMLILYTDGLIESTRDILAGERALRDTVARDAILYASSPALFIRDACLPNGSRDDAAILVLTFSSERRWSFDAENAQAAHDARADFVRYLTEHASDGDFEAAEIIFGELIGNVVRHAPGPIDVHVDWNEAYAVLHVTDRGPGLTRRPALPADLMHESGRGLYIMQSLARNVEFETLPGYGTHVAVELPVRRS